MKNLFLLITFALVNLVALQACTQVAKPPPAVSSPEKPGARTGEPGPASWEQRWNDTLREAKKEGKLVFYSSANPQTRTAVIEAFKQKFGIELEFLAGIATENIRRLQNEHQAGIRVADLFNAGYSILQVKNAGILAPLGPSLILPEVTNPAMWLSDKLPFLDKDGQVIAFFAGYSTYLVINTEMVKEGQLTSYMDLLKPEWKGKIVMYDPTIPGGSNEWISMMLLNVLGMEKGKEYFARFVAQEPVIMRDNRLPAEWVAKGKYPLVIGVQKQSTNEFIAAGAPMKYPRLAEGGLVTASAGMIGRIRSGPQPNASTVFLNWLLSREGQAIYARNYGFPSARVDVPAEGIDPSLVPAPGEKLTIVDEEWYLTRDKLLPTIKELFSR